MATVIAPIVASTAPGGPTPMEPGAPAMGRRRTPHGRIRPVRAPLLPSPKDKESRGPGDGQARPVAALRPRHARSGSPCEPGSAHLFHNFPRRHSGARRTDLPATPWTCRGQPLLRGRALRVENWGLDFFPKIRCVPSPQFSPLPVTQRRGPQGWGKRHVHPAASHSTGLTQHHAGWWSKLLPPLLHSRAGPAPWLSWPLQPLHSRSAVQAPLRSSKLCTAWVLPGKAFAAWRAPRTARRPALGRAPTSGLPGFALRGVAVPSLASPALLGPYLATPSPPGAPSSAQACAGLSGLDPSLLNPGFALQEGLCPPLRRAALAWRCLHSQAHLRPCRLNKGQTPPK